MITQPHITADHRMGQFLTAQARHAEIIVEVGTGSGLGSTQRLIAGLQDDAWLYTLEANTEQWASALLNLPKQPNVIAINGLLHRGIMPYYHPLDRDVDRQNWEYEYSLAMVAPITTAPPHIDLLLLDGGDYLSTGDFMLLNQRSKVIVLDDVDRTKANKNWFAHACMKQSPHWEMLVEDFQERNGWSAFRRKS